jgi:formate dehydrogenase iron-sulfur subunit
VSSDTFELKASARLLSTQLRSLLLLRGALLVMGGIILPLRAHVAAGLVLAFAAAFIGEIIGRYLFFVSVVPKNMAACYLSSQKAAA